MSHSTRVGTGPKHASACAYSAQTSGFLLDGGQRDVSLLHFPRLGCKQCKASAAGAGRITPMLGPGQRLGRVGKPEELPL